MRKVPDEFKDWQKSRALGDRNSHLKLSSKSISIRLPEDVDAWVRLKGTAWLRNLLCDLYDDTEN